MEALAVDAQLLRAVLTPEINLTVGRVLAARVVELAAGGRGTLSLAGVLLDAELPAVLRPGQEIRLQVREATPQRIVLSLQEEPAAATPPPPLAAAPLPGGGSVRVTQRDQVTERDSESSRRRSGGESTGVHMLALTYDAPRLGAVDMQFALHPSSLQLGLALAAGLPHELAQDAAGQLEEALTEAVGRPVTVTIKPRYDPLDVYA